MSLTQFFDQLGAPLANSRWSWGAQRARDGVVFMRVWQDEKRFENERQLTLPNKRNEDPDPSRNYG